MFDDYFQVNADVRPGIKNKKITTKTKQTQKEIAEKSLLIKLYQSRVAAGRDIWTGKFITDLHDRFL